MRIKTWLSAALASLILACGCSESAERPAGVLYVGTNAEFAPFEYTDTSGKVMGFDIDIIRAMAKAGGYQIQINNIPWDGIFATLGSGDNDVLISAVTVTEERKMTMDFSDTYFSVIQVIMAPDTGGIEDFDGLMQARKVGVATGQTGDLTMSAWMGATSGRVSRYDTVMLAIEAMQAGAVDAVVTDSAVAQEYIKNHPDEHFRIIFSDRFVEENYGIAVRRGDAGTLKLINDSLRKIRDNGEYERIRKRYFGNSSAQ